MSNESRFRRWKHVINTVVQWNNTVKHSALWDTLFLTEGYYSRISSRLCVQVHVLAYHWSCWGRSWPPEASRGRGTASPAPDWRASAAESTFWRPCASEDWELRRTEAYMSTALPTHNQRTLLELLYLLGCHVNTTQNCVTTSNLSKKYILYMRHWSTKSVIRVNFSQIEIICIIWKLNK